MTHVRAALRQFRKAPGFPATVILLLSLGIGVNTAIFTLVHAVLLRSLPVAGAARLYRVGDQLRYGQIPGFNSKDGDFYMFSYDFYRHLRDATPEFEQLAAFQSYSSSPMNVRTGTSPGRIAGGEYVSGNYFLTFGVGAYAGRVLMPNDDLPGAAPVAVLSYASWKAQYGGNPNVIGSPFFIKGHPVTVVGIAQSGFFGDRISADPPDLWLPLNVEPILAGQNSWVKLPNSNWLYLLGRVKPGIAPGGLQEKLSNLLRQWMMTQPFYMAAGNSELIPKQHVIVVPGGAGIERFQRDQREALRLLTVVSALVLLIACANVANLLLVRGMYRRMETAIRVALGAARSILIRQFLLDSVLLSAVAGVIGIGIAYLGVRLVLTLAFPDSPAIPIHASPSPVVLGFAFLLSLLTGVACGIVPAWNSSGSDPASALRGLNRSVGDRSLLLQKALVVIQASLSLVLFVGAGLLSRTLINLERQDYRLNTANRYVIHIDTGATGYGPEQSSAFNQQLEDRISAIPGIRKVGIAIYTPLEGFSWGQRIYVQGRPKPAPEDDIDAIWNRVSPGFFDSIGQPVIRGRGFTEIDTSSAPLVAVVNQSFAKKFFPTEDPIGRHFGTSDRHAADYEIIGVVADVKYQHPRDPVKPIFVRPMSQWNKSLSQPDDIADEGLSLFPYAILVEFAGDPGHLESEVRAALSNIHPELTVTYFSSLNAQVADNFIQERLVSRLTELYGLLVLAVAAVGIYGITAYSVARRTSEIGLRMALGANRRQVVIMVLGSALWLVVLGIVVGLPIAALGGHLIQSQLYNVKGYDPLTLTVAVVILIASAVVAGLIPARHAASIEPMTALRSELL